MSAADLLLVRLQRVRVSSKEPFNDPGVGL